MTRLLAETPLGGLDVAHGGLRLVETNPGQLTWLAPHPGQEQALSHALQLAHGVSFPGPGTSAQNGNTRILWSGRAQAILFRADPAVELALHAAVIDQTEGWAVLKLTGARAAEALARLCPLDLRPATFTEGHTARSLLGHMNAQITATEDGFDLMVIRSMAGTAANEIEEAMRSLATRS